MKKNILFLLIATCLIVVNGDEELDIEEATVEIDETPANDVKYESPKPSDTSKVYLADHFDDPGLSGKVWIKSQAKKEGISEDIAKYDGEWAFEPPLKDSLKGDSGLVLKTKAKHAAISAFLKKPFVFSEKPIVVQYEVTLQEGQECGGSYIKLLSQSTETKKLDQFHDKTPYSIMFGPDKCGNDHKLHFIFKHVNPLNGSVEEKHCSQPKQRLDELIGDKLPHLYTLEVRPDNTFEISIDGKSIHSGSLLEDFAPAVNPPAEIDDPTDQKPDDWDEREKISDPEATKPEDWDEDAPAQIVDESAVMPEGWLEDELPHIPDPEATKPEDWDSEMDGEWEPPLVDNPACADAPGCGPWEPPLVANPSFKGKWRAPLVDNPNYKGKWRPKKIPNPDYFNDEHPFRMQSVVAVGFELWSMSQNMLFDNIIITDDIEVAQQWAADSFEKKRQKIAQDSVTLWGRMMHSMNYSPKAWGLYFIYCLIPVGIYVWYLVTCVVEESFIEKIADLTVKYPALWALYILVLGIPVVFILYLCCRSSPQEKEESDLAERKKTDAVTKDTKIEEAVPEVDEEGDAVEEEGDAVEEEEGEDRERKSDSDTDEQEAKGEDSPGPDVTAAEGTRKRPVRKE